MIKLVIVIPVYNDWECLTKLVTSIKEVVSLSNIDLVRVIAVNDNSSVEPEVVSAGILKNLEIINLSTNVGHQRAIAIGLAYVNENYKDFDSVIIMDSDGEDDPVYIPELCKSAISKGQITFANRIKRSESFLFICFYHIYKLVFKILTNQSISFGNYSCIPTQQLSRVVQIPELWNHYSGSIIKSKLHYSLVHAKRSKRYFGQSKMNFHHLVIHGLSSISIYIEVVISKLFLFALTGIALVSFSVIGIALIKLFTDLAIPGWASNVILALLNLGGLLFIVTLLLLLVQLSNRSNQTQSVLKFYRDYIYSIKKVE